MTKPINPHGEAELDPSDYEFVHFFDNNPVSLAAFGAVDPEAWELLMERLTEWRDKLVAESNSVYGKIGQCAHCGNAIRYHVVYRHVPSGALVAIGQDCAQNRLDRSPAEWKSYKAELDAMREKARRGEKRIKVREQFPEATDLLERCMDELGDLDEMNPTLHGSGWDGSDEEIERYGEALEEFRARWPEFVVDIALRYKRHGTLTERQAAAVVEYVPKHRERVATRKREREEADPVPTGKGIEVEGTVVSVKWKENGYGGAWKMVVKGDDGWAVWGTVPRSLDDEATDLNQAAIDTHKSDYEAACKRAQEAALEQVEDAEISDDLRTDLIASLVMEAVEEWQAENPRPEWQGTETLKGCRVRFVANVTRSDDDESFGFFKRPRKAELIAEAGLDAEGEDR